MSRIKTTLTHLRRLRRGVDTLLAAADETDANALAASSALSTLADVVPRYGNPGDLGMKVYVPAKLARRPALVVVLHGCDQTAAEYDRGSGWSMLAERAGFVLLYPEQKASNNAKNCFSWFQPGDVARGAGEAMSIAQMVEQVAVDYRVDRARIFVTGLSAGGAMTAALLATYPDLFATGAIIGGLPFGSARSMQEAFECMFGDRVTTAHVLGDRVRGASDHAGPWPHVSVWHGTEDTTVRASNAEELVRQWTNVHGLSAAPTSVEEKGAHRRRRWTNAKGHVAVEHYSLAGMGHGVPVDLRQGHASIGAKTPFFLDVGISSTEQIAVRWGLIDASAAGLGDGGAWSKSVDTSDRSTQRVEASSRPKSRNAARAVAPALVAAPFARSEGTQAQSSPAAFDPVDPFGLIDATLRVAGLKK